MTMKQYLRRLWLALTGEDPFACEVSDLREKLERAGENVRSLNEMYYSAVERWAAAEKQAKSLQTLVENLRERNHDKDALIKRMDEEYRKQILELTKSVKQQ